MLILCPPYNPAQEGRERDRSTFCGQLVKRILPVSIATGKSHGHSRIVAHKDLVDGTRVYRTRVLAVEYEFPEDISPSTKSDANEPMVKAGDDDEDEDDDDDKTEFEIPNNSNHKPAEESEEGRKMIASATSDIKGEEDVGLSLWKNAISNTESFVIDTTASASASAPAATTTTTTTKQQTSRKDLDTAVQLELLSQRAHNASDASFLEDFGEGLPYLSGACRGFAFDYTENCILGSNGKGGADTLTRFLQLLEDRQAAFCNKLLSRAIDYIVPCGNDLAKWSYGRFGLAHNKWDHTLMTLECFPALRGIGISETAAEFAELKAREEMNATKCNLSRRRTTRTQSLTRGGGVPQASIATIISIRS